MRKFGVLQYILCAIHGFVFQPMTRAFSVLLTLCVACQALGGSGATLICRYTGRVMDPCACPDEPKSNADYQRLSDQGCCELRNTQAPSVPGLVKATAPGPVKQVSISWLTPPTSQSFLAKNRAIDITPREQAPPSTPLYLSIRSLLI